MTELENYKQWLADNLRLNYAYPSEYRQENYRKECKLTKAQAFKTLKELIQELEATNN
tara:strand:- start:1830 stop:2003 length:174 start_codon:yes stop_codon:yes gene_type:complete